MKTRPIFTLLLCLLWTTAAMAGGSDLVLVEVNGEPITGADLESMIIEAHASGMDAGRAEGLVPRLLEKAVKDRLILQDAFAMGMDQEPEIAGPVEREARNKAISLYARANVELPEVSDAEVREYFEEYYRKVRVRQLTLASEPECRDAMARIRAGEVTMGELATQVSLDPWKDQGGLHKEKYWIDIPFDLRDAVVDLAPGEFSPPYAQNGQWTFVRLESRTPADETEYERREESIRTTIRNYEYEQAWAALVKERRGEVEVKVDEGLLAGIREDEPILYRGEFRVGARTPLLSIDADHFVTEADFRTAMSKLAMEMGTSTFEEILDRALTQQEERLVMAWCAARDGYFESPEVVDLYQRRLEQEVLNAYLTENIGQKIRLNREEYEQFYRDHADDFRGPDEIRLSILTSDKQAEIEDVAARLADGADFDYLRTEVSGRDPEADTESQSWSPVTVFSDAIIEAVDALEVGQTSPPIPYGYSWMIVRLDGRREGSVQPIDAVDGAIREALYYREFSRLLDEHLARLESASVIVRHEDRIRAWADSES